VRHLYGEAGPRIRRELGWANAQEIVDFEKAVRAAVWKSEPGDVLLLSPGCTSFDQHVDYAQRGQAFAAFARRALSEKHDADE
jgi:UDP-N-acetylmuramoylalanine--D-glutamate ligase